MPVIEEETDEVDNKAEIAPPRPKQTPITTTTVNPPSQQQTQTEVSQEVAEECRLRVDVGFQVQCSVV